MQKKDRIVQLGDPILREVAAPVPASFAKTKLHKILIDMRDALSGEETGVAIAAPQIGTSLRIFLVAPRAFLEPEEIRTDSLPMVFINPKLSRLSRKKKEMSEGCLSVRGTFGTVLRHEKATVQAINEKGEIFTYHGSQLMAQIFQHEIDHLDGILYIDKALQYEEEEAHDPTSDTL